MEEKLYRKHIIETAMGLQAVDGLKCSPFFVSQAERYIEGEISLAKLEAIIDEYYKNKSIQEQAIAGKLNKA